jgi:hypothetical protein
MGSSPVGSGGEVTGVSGPGGSGVEPVPAVDWTAQAERKIAKNSNATTFLKIMISSEFNFLSDT